MADTNITKRALAAALKELMEHKAFEKISVSDICEACNMNRKSFYYHFKDKYDLVNWIFYSEFMPVIQCKEYETAWGLLDDLCRYFYKNRSFYRRTFAIEGQNSFSEYFRDIAASLIRDDLKNIFGEDKEIEFYVDFYADAYCIAVKRWLQKKDWVSADEFASLIKKCLVEVAESILKQRVKEEN